MGIEIKLNGVVESLQHDTWGTTTGFGFGSQSRPKPAGEKLTIELNREFVVRCDQHNEQCSCDILSWIGEIQRSVSPLEGGRIYALCDCLPLQTVASKTLVARQEKRYSTAPLVSVTCQKVPRSS